MMIFSGPSCVLYNNYIILVPLLIILDHYLYNYYHEYYLVDEIQMCNIITKISVIIAYSQSMDSAVTTVSVKPTGLQSASMQPINVFILSVVGSNTDSNNIRLIIILSIEFILTFVIIIMILVAWKLKSKRKCIYDLSVPGYLTISFYTLLLLYRQ